MGDREVPAEAEHNLHIADLPGNTCTYLYAYRFLFCRIRQAIA